MRRPADVFRSHLNRVLVVAVLLVGLPTVVIAERVRKGSGAAVARWWIRVAARLTAIQFETRGRPHPRAGEWQILVANHSSLLDIAAILATHPTARFAAGADLYRIPLLSSAMRALGTVPVDRKSGRGAHLTVPEDSDPGSLVVFAEGAIAPIGTRLPFRRGAFALAIEKQAEVVPVAIHDTASRLAPKSWLRVYPGLVVVDYLPPMATHGLVLADRRRLSSQAEQAVLGALAPTSLVMTSH